MAFVREPDADWSLVKEPNLLLEEEEAVFVRVDAALDKHTHRLIVNDRRDVLVLSNIRLNQDVDARPAVMADDVIIFEDINDVLFFLKQKLFEEFIGENEV